MTVNKRGAACGRCARGRAPEAVKSEWLLVADAAWCEQQRTTGLDDNEECNGINKNLNKFQTYERLEGGGSRSAATDE